MSFDIIKGRAAPMTDLQLEISFLVLAVAAAEVVVDLALIVSIFRTRRNIDVDEMNILRG